eukprot:GHVR01094919.1.p1 GENE.GHVR01094919.1~~GHVR01094919.1.p1  ORF type:complete len:153 (+),score=43.40 GHVR01094919.1:328-786(+)
MVFAVVVATVKDLSGCEAATLLTTIADNLHDSPLILHHRYMWLKELLKQHMNDLSNMPQAHTVMKDIATQTATRLTYQSTLLRLQGRVDGLLHQATQRLTVINQRRMLLEESRRPLCEYEEAETADECEDADDSDTDITQSSQDTEDSDTQL